MASPTRGLLKIGLGAGALYFIVMRNLDVVTDWYNQRYLQRMQDKALMRSLAQEKQEMLAQQGS